MNDDRRTKAEILTNEKNLEDQLAAARALLPRKLEPVPVAESLAACIRALDPLKGSTGRNQFGLAGSNSEIKDVLVHLMRRYDINLTERITEPCDRMHLDEAPDDALLARLRGMAY